MTTNPFQTTIIQALHQGGDMLLKYFGKVSDIKVKENLSSVVSEADVASEKVILDLIRQEFPDHNIISEECGYVNNNSEYTWVVDPLDGTSNFIAGLPWFGILIALMKNDVPVAAGAYLPIDKQLYYAGEGNKARLNEQIIQISQSSQLEEVLVAYSLDFNADFYETLTETKIIAKLVQKTRNVRSTNCLLDLCYTADGRLGAVINQHEKIWDIAAPWLIIKEAGGIITDTNAMELNFQVDERDYNKDFPIVAANPHIHQKIMKFILETNH
jgi:myo-inositol-1(or 4)-monophosphatase